MADFVVQDDVQHSGARHVARLLQAALDGWRRIQAARFEQAGHQSHAGERVVGRFHGHLPQPGVGREIAVVMAKAVQTFAQNGEVIGLLGGDSDPIGVIGLRQAREARRMIECQVDGGEFDMHDGVQQASPPFDRGRAALRNLLGRDQFGFIRAAAHQFQGECVIAVEPSLLPVFRQPAGQGQLVFDVGCCQCSGQAGEEGIHRGAGLV